MVAHQTAQLHVQQRKDGGVSAICPDCGRRRRATEQMLSWVLFCGCGFTGEVASKPVRPCHCKECKTKGD
jgi:hypothetical protein